MFTRKLTTLEYDKPSCNIEDESEFRQLIYWLENKIIRFYPPDGRDFLLPTAENWNNGLTTMLNDLSYPGSRTERKLIVDYLLTLALQFAMEDTRNQLKLSKEQISNFANETTANDLAKVDVNSSDFIDGLRGLASLLDVPFYQDEPLITLRAIAILIKRLQKSQITGAQASSVNGSKKSKLTSQADESVLTKPFSKSSKYDPTLNRAANVLRLLYINDLKELQTQVNAMLVQLQSLTANPKTDSRLGQVGR